MFLCVYCSLSVFVVVCVCLELSSCMAFFINKFGSVGLDVCV